MKSIKVSVVVPVYNAASYLARCLESILLQSLKEIEIIVVNDGSNDESEKIMEEFAAKDERIIIINGENQGVSAARNKGLDAAHGEYIGFVDADDWIEQNMYERLCGAVTEVKADWVVCNVNVWESDKVVRKRLQFESVDFANESNQGELMRNLLRFKYDYSNWNKLYKRSILQEHNIRFNQSMTVWEDLLFNSCYLLFSKKLTVINDCLYNYRTHPNSVMGKQTHNAVAEYSLLYRAFHQFCGEVHNSQLVKVFDVELRRGFYYAVLPGLVTQIRLKEKSAAKRIRKLGSILKGANKGLFNYSPTELGVGVQRLKKKLLKRGWFLGFSLGQFLK